MLLFFFVIELVAQEENNIRNTQRAYSVGLSTGVYKSNRASLGNSVGLDVSLSKGNRKVFIGYNYLIELNLFGPTPTEELNLFDISIGYEFELGPIWISAGLGPSYSFGISRGDKVDVQPGLFGRSIYERIKVNEVGGNAILLLDFSLIKNFVTGFAIKGFLSDRVELLAKHLILRYNF